MANRAMAPCECQMPQVELVTLYGKEPVRAARHIPQTQQLDAADRLAETDWWTTYVSGTNANCISTINKVSRNAYY
jgi:hypothetical protein